MLDHLALPAAAVTSEHQDLVEMSDQPARQDLLDLPVCKETLEHRDQLDLEVSEETLDQQDRQARLAPRDKRGL